MKKPVLTHRLFHVWTGPQGASGSVVFPGLGEGRRLVNAVDIYVSPFGEVSVVANRFLDANSALVVDTEYWSRAVLRPMQTIVLSKTGDSDKRQMLTELTLVCENSKASGLIDDLTA